METITTDAIARIHASDLTAALAVTGGGSRAVHRLLACPGASRTVAQVEIPYGPSALARYLGHAPAQAVSAETAARLAAVAYARARRSDGEGSSNAVGLACTAALATDRNRRGDEQGFLAARTADEDRSLRVTFEKGRAPRAEQEVVLGELMLDLFAGLAGVPDCGGLEPKGVTLERSARPRRRPLHDLAEGLRETVVIEADGRVHGEHGDVDALLAASFNPAHGGHLAMAAAASRRLKRRVDFEFSLVNADKTPVRPDEAMARLQGLAWGGRTLATRAPTFAEKTRLFPGCVFVVGFDTATRVLEERFYGGHQGMLKALDEIRERGSRFLVAGRAEDGVFLGVDRLEVPDGYADLFEEIPEEAFREDISSTEIRRVSEKLR